MKEILDYRFKYLVQIPPGCELPETLAPSAARAVRRFHRQLPDYHPTPLVRLANLARAWGVADIFVKDEAARFGLKAFKALGGSYAVARLVCRKLNLDIRQVPYARLVSDEVREKIGRITLATATDGNHGRGVAWAAERLGQKAVVFMPKGSVSSRVAAIRSHGATVTVTNLNYDDTVRMACRTADENGWHLVQDTTGKDDDDVALWIMQGYLTMCSEAVDQLQTLGARPTHIFVQAGVGSLAGAVVGYLAQVYQEPRPKFIIMEPNNAACILASAAAGDGRPHAVTGDLSTIMVGLACGEPNPLSWEILRDIPSGYISCDDFVAANGMRVLAHPVGGDPFVEAGESGAVGIGVIDLLANHTQFETLKNELAMGPDSTLLCFNTEGATDPENYREIVRHGKYPGIDKNGSGKPVYP